MRKRFVNRAISLLLTIVMLVGMLPVAFAVDYNSVSSPFNKGDVIDSSVTSSASNSFRIPALVTLSDGTLVAAADTRWNTTYDGGGLDTAVAWSTDNGQSWTTTFANYLGDNGDSYDGTRSSCFIDPALVVTENNTIYMLCDLYPYGVALNGNKDTAPDTARGFGTSGNSAGKLLLSADNHSSYGYYLDGDMIYSTDGTAVSGYTVDGYFNLYQDGTYVSNLFFYDSPYKVVRTGFLYLTSSTDKGQTWSEPTLLDLKTTDEQVCLVAPGRGLVTSDGTIIFPCYSFHGDNDPSGNTQRLSFIYCEDGINWERSAELDYNWASEAAAIELADGTLRFFFRNGTTNLCYVDYKDSWGTPVCLNGSGDLITVDTNSNCQISAITYSEQVDEKQVVLVSCPTGANNAGSNLSSASARLNGKIFAFTIDGSGTMTQISSVALTSQNSSTNYFMYSCLTELSDGSIGILYEDNENAWGTGDNYYYQMTYATVTAAELGLTNSTAVSDTDDGVYMVDGENSVIELDCTITSGEDIQIVVTGLADDQTILFESSDETIATATLSDNTIIVTALVAGSAVISGTVVNSNAVSTFSVNDMLTINVTVETAPVGAFFTEDGTNPVTALTIDMADGNVAVTLANVDAITSVSSSNTDVAMVSFAGNEVTIDPVAEGSTVITATVGTMTYDLAVSVTATAEEEEPIGEYTVTDSNSGVVITVDSPVLTSVSVTKKATANTPHAGYTACATYDVVINGGAYTGAAQIKIPYDNAFGGCNTFIGDVGGETFAVNLVDGYFVGTVPHFSDVDINGVADTYDVLVNLGEGTSSGIYVVPDGATGYESWDSTSTTESLAGDIGEYTVTTYTQTTDGTSTTTRGAETSAITSGSQYVIASGSNTLITSGTGYDTGTLMAQGGTVTDTALWTIISSGDGYTISQDIGGTTYYLTYEQTEDGDMFSGKTFTNTLTLSTTSSVWSYSNGSFYQYLYVEQGGLFDWSYTSENHYLTGAWSLSTTQASVDLYSVMEQTVGGTTTIVKTVQFKGEIEGTAYVPVDGTTYKVVVHGDSAITIYYQLDGITVSQEIKSVNYGTTSLTLTTPIVIDEVELTPASTTLPLTEGVTEYYVSVSGGKAVTITYKHGDIVVKTETRVVEDADSVTLTAKDITVDGNTYQVPETVLDLSGGATTFEIQVSSLIGITINYKTENGYIVRTVLNSVNDTESSLTLAHTIEGTDGNTYTVTGETGDFEFTLMLPDQTVYSVLVDYLEVPVTLAASSNYQITHAEGYDDSNLTECVSTSYNFTDGTLTVTGVSVGDGGWVIVNANKYVFTVVGELSVELKTGETLEIDLSDPDGFNLILQDGQYVEWESSDSTYAGVAGVYDNTNKTFTDAAVIAGQAVTTNPVTVTATVYNADGTISGTYNWKVTVVQGDADTNTTQKWVYLAVDQLLDCDLYYSVNGGPLIQIKKENPDGLDVIINELVTGKYFLAIFAAPDHQGAMTSMKATYSAGEFSILTNGDPDGVGSDAWPFADDYDWTQYDEYVAENGYPAGGNADFFDTNCGFRWALAEGNLTAQQYKLMLSNAIELGCEGAICFTKNATGETFDDAEQDNDIHTVLTVVGQDLPSVTKQISRVEYEIDNGNGTTTTGYRKAVNGEWGIKLYDTIIYNINVHIPAQIESGDADIDYGHFDLTNITLSDQIMGKDFTGLGGVITCIDGGGYLTNGRTYSSGDTLFSSLEQPEEGNSIDLAFEASIQLTPANFNTLFGGTSSNDTSLLYNTVALGFTYKSDYASDTASKTDTEEIEAYVWYDTYVVDFGLPTVIDLSSAPYLHGNTDYELTSITTYLEHYMGQATIEEDLANESFTYTLLAPLTAYDIAGYTVTNKYDSSDVVTYYIYIVPASNMLYEEGFLTAPEGSHPFYADWKGENVSTVNKSGSMQGFDAEGNALPGTNVIPYGYDAAYASQTGYSGGYYTTTVSESKFLSAALTSTLTNVTGFDVIGDVGPNSANLYVLVRANTAGALTRIIVVDTTFEDDTYGTLHQTPLVHVSGLDPAVSYEINISAGYMEKTSVASLTSFGGGSPIFQIYSNLYELGLTDEEIENAEFVGFDDYNSISFLSNEDIMTVAEGDQTLVIDGFRLYHDTDNSAYYSATNAAGQMMVWEYNAVYTNVSDDTYVDEDGNEQDIEGSFYAYVEPNTVTDEETGNTTDYVTGSYAIADYDAIGGPQGEIYLPAGSGIVFKLSSVTADNPLSDDETDLIDITSAQVSARAVTGATTMVSGTDASAVSTLIETNTEMYYTVAVDDNGCISIVNNGKNMLAIANIKALAPLAEISDGVNAAQAEQAVTLMMAAYRANTSDSSPENNTIEVTDQFWTDSNGQIVFSIPEGEVSSVYTVQNKTGTETTITLMLGAYDVNGKLLDVQSVSTTLQAGEDGELAITAFLPNGTSEVKSFIMDGEMTPLCNSATLNY